MGCASSNFSYDCNESIYEASLQDRSKPCKRNFSKRLGSTDSSDLDTEESTNASNFWSSTSNSSRCSTPPPPPKVKLQQKKTKLKRTTMLSKLSSRHMPRALAKLTLGDKSKAEPASPSPPCRQQQLEQSNGYFSASTDNFESSNASSFEKPSLLLCTQNIDTTTNTSTNTANDSYISAQPDLNEPISNIKMEILMLRDNRQMMPKTSSPYCARRDTFACSGNASYTGTYRRWIQCLENAPAYMFKDITAIPEAIAGQFSPANHPAYTNLWNSECVSAAKRYRPDHSEHDSPNGVCNALVSTEL